jgi:hypothetical protein
MQRLVTDGAGVTDGHLAERSLTNGHDVIHK